MNRSAIKIRIIILLASSSVLSLFGLVETYTDWLSKPLGCYEINSQTNVLRESKDAYDFCIEHIYLPYQEKQGSVTLGVRSSLKENSYLYTTTTFWIADELGAEKFSDVEGDFTTKRMRRYNSLGFMSYNRVDVETPEGSAPYSTKDYKAYCDKVPIFLNDLFMDPHCIEKQKIAWTKVQQIAPDLLNNYSLPFSKLLNLWISSNPFKVLGAIFFIIAVAKFYWLLYPRRKLLEKETSHRAQSTAMRLKQNRQMIVHFMFALAILSGTSYILNNTIYLIPADLLCLQEHHSDRNRLSISRESFVKGVCINEILESLNTYQGQIKLGMVILYADGTKTVTESTIFVSEKDNFQDVPGDMMHSKISNYNKFGILENRSFDLVGEQIANLMPEKVSVAIWNLVKDKLTGNNQVIYVSVQRVLGEVLEDSLPFMLAAYALLYTYSLYLMLTFGKD